MSATEIPTHGKEVLFAIIADDRNVIYAMGKSEAACIAEYNKIDSGHPYGTGSEVVVKCSRRLFEEVEVRGGGPEVRWHGGLSGIDLDVPCECGEALGHGGCALKSDGTVVEFMPEDLRNSHREARNAGTYPSNGAIRLQVCADCAEDVLAANHEWASLVQTGGAL